MLKNVLRWAGLMMGGVVMATVPMNGATALTLKSGATSVLEVIPASIRTTPDVGQSPNLLALSLPEDLLYVEHEWVHVQGKYAVVGIISVFAQKLFGDITAVELPREGEVYRRIQSSGALESTSGSYETFTPVSGRVVAVNTALYNVPQLINEDPYGKGWLFVIEMSDPDELNSLLVDADQYRPTFERFEREGL